MKENQLFRNSTKQGLGGEEAHSSRRPGCETVMVPGAEGKFPMELLVGLERVGGKMGYFQQQPQGQANSHRREAGGEQTGRGSRRRLERSL